ncbi:transcription factor Tfb2 [Ordospora pajunii]|uniref:transcription factor Tfb2 n=1 Tax=Ordospora pajunii TaxID=3039483 RepID=UPI0029526690|nr:transcription factor Tfb2 [Ordospora pajunii]KAH9412159.1 transcription factor Tfb2 [Ordospora pajunii]
MMHKSPQAWPYPIDVVEYFRLLPKDLKIHLYKAPIFAVSFLKIFDEDTRRFVMDLVLRSPSIGMLREVDGVKNMLKTLLKVQVIEKKRNNIYLDEDFRKSLMDGFCMLVMEKYYRKTHETIAMDEERSSQMFESILRFIVNKEFKSHAFGINEIVVFGGLLDKQKNITNRGFEFLLKTKKEQLWCLVLLSLKYFASSVEEEVAAVEAFFELSAKTVGVLYDQVCVVNGRLLKYFEALGILKMHGEKLAVGKNLLRMFEASERSKREFVIVETNNRVYAYTSSEYEKSVIHLFCDVIARLPNLIKGMITEESTNAAFDKGITARQIIHFLESSIKIGELPETVCSQIEIWESKRNKIFMVPGYLYSNFLNFSDYQKVLKFCVDGSHLVESDADKRIIVVKLDGHSLVKEFMKTIL